MPGYVNAEGVGFYGARRVQREEAWHWTGYYHNEWQIWQGNEPLILYLVNSEEPRYAYEYRWQRGCY